MRSSHSGLSRRVWLLGALATLAGLLASYVTSRWGSRIEHDAPEIQGLLWPNPKRVGAFALDSTDGKGVDLPRLTGRWTFFFFGFTFCPDVCPTTLTTMAAAMRQIRGVGTANDVQTIFVSVDPARDTLKRMKSYVEFFDSTFIGATAPLGRLDVLTRQLGIPHFRGEPDQDGNYTVDHSASILLVDPETRLVGVFGTPHVAADIAQRFQAMRDFIESRS